MTVTDAPLAPGHGYQGANGTWGPPLGVFWRRQKGRIARNGAVTRGGFLPRFMTNQARTRDDEVYLDPSKLRIGGSFTVNA